VKSNILEKKLERARVQIPDKPETRESNILEKARTAKLECGVYSRKN
jgi:hypothetical protein